MTKHESALTDEQLFKEMTIADPRWNAHGNTRTSAVQLAKKILLAKQAAQVEPVEVRACEILSLGEWVLYPLERYEEAKERGRQVRRLVVEPAAATTTEAQVEPVVWGVDWGKNGDRSCVSILKKHADGTIEVVATEYEPPPRNTTPPASSALVEVAERVSRAWAIEGDYVTAMNAAVTELRTAIEAEKKGRV